MIQWARTAGRHVHTQHDVVDARIACEQQIRADIAWPGEVRNAIALGPDVVVPVFGRMIRARTVARTVRTPPTVTRGYLRSAVIVLRTVLRLRERGRGGSSSGAGCIVDALSTAPPTPPCGSAPTSVNGRSSSFPTLGVSKWRKFSFPMADGQADCVRGRRSGVGQSRDFVKVVGLHVTTRSLSNSCK